MGLKPSVQITLVIVLGILVLAGLMIFVKPFASPYGEKNAIQVSGQSTIKVSPDLITIYYSLETKGKTPKEAEDKNSEILKNLTSQIEKLGFKEEELKTQNFNIYPEYDWQNNEQKLTGYVAAHSLKIELSTGQRDKIGDLIAAGTDSGAGISYINFELTDGLEQEYKAKAIKTAASDAKIKAKALAEGFDKKVGRLISVSINEWGYTPWIAYGALEAGASSEMVKDVATRITPSEQEVSASVSAVYRLR